jgi:hypothetical protein
VPETFISASGSVLVWVDAVGSLRGAGGGAGAV